MIYVCLFFNNVFHGLFFNFFIFLIFYFFIF